MVRYYCIFFLLCIGLDGFGQEIVKPQSLDSTTTSKWNYEGFSYADFGTGEQHSDFSILRELSPNLFAELRAYYDTYRVADVFDVSMRVRWYPTKKLYLFSGLGVQVQRSKVGLLPIMPVRMLNGVGYEPNDNLTIEAVHNLNFNATDTGLNSTPNLFTLKGRYRF